MVVWFLNSTAYPLRSFTRHEKHIALLLTILLSISLGDRTHENVVQGKYILIGKGLDTDKTYFGSKIKSVNNKIDR